MKGILRTVVAAGSVAALGVLAYRVLLTDEAKDALRSSVSEVKNSVASVNSVLGDERDKSAEVAANQRRTQMQWESLGF